jgi:hypothetical protein
MNSGFYSILNISLSLFSLFNDDIKALFLPTEADKAIEITNAFIFFFFTFDIIFSTLLRKGFYLSFYFFLDLIAIIASIPEVKFIWTPLINLFIEDGENIDFEDGSMYNDFVNNAGKNTKLGTK